MITQNKQRGTAIIVALFVTSLVAIAATVMIERLRLDVHRTELSLNDNNATLYAQGSVTWAMDQLIKNWKLQKTGQIIDKTPIKSPVDKVNGATISTVIYDLQGRFNINNLTDQNEQKGFAHLLQTVAPTLDQNTALNIAQAAADWISPGTKNPALDEYYLKSIPPYRASHRPMVSVSELRLVKGVTPELYPQLEPYVTALPQATQININNADIPTLMSLNPTLTMETAKAIVAHRTGTPFTNLQQLASIAGAKNSIPENKITIASGYFLVQSQITIGQQQTILYTVLQRVAKDSQVKILVLWQSKGAL